MVTETTNYLLHCIEEAKNKDWADGIRFTLATIGHCKDCKFFVLNSWAAYGGVPIIVAHEICKAWGDGCKTKRDGYCFMFEPKENEEETK